VFFVILICHWLLVIQPLGWLVTKVTVGSCSFGIALQFRILGGGNMLHYGNTAKQGGYIFALPRVSLSMYFVLM
jgi:hypothetical protein